MYQLALTLSIISSLLFIVYLLMAIFAPRQQQDNTITIKGSFVTRNVNPMDFYVDNAMNESTITKVIKHH